jgi:hypothetical protein
MQDIMLGGSFPLEGSIRNSSIEAIGAINSLLDEKRLVDAYQWALSLVKSTSKEHAFLLLEGKVKNEFTIFRTDLFLRKDTDKSLFGQKINKGSVIDRLFDSSASSKGRAFIKVAQLSAKDYDEIIINSEYQGWVIDPNQAEKLLKRLQTEGLKEYNYHSGGDSSGFSLSDSRSTRTNCIAWCETILKEELSIRLGEIWIPVLMPSSRVKLAQKFSETPQQQLTSPKTSTAPSPIDPRVQRQQSRARMSAEQYAKYFQPIDTKQPPRSIVDPTYAIAPDSWLVTIASGKIQHTKNHVYLILESIEEQHYTFRRIDLMSSFHMELVNPRPDGTTFLTASSQQCDNMTLVEIQSMIDEYTIDSDAILPRDGATLRTKIEEESQRRVSTSATINRIGPRMFSKSSNTPRPDFIASLKGYLQSIGVGVLLKNINAEL